MSSAFKRSICCTLIELQKKSHEMIHHLETKEHTSVIYNLMSLLCITRIILPLFHLYHLSSVLFCASCFTHSIPQPNFPHNKGVWKAQPDDAYHIVSFNHYSMLSYFHIYINLIPRLWCWIIILSMSTFQEVTLPLLLSVRCLLFLTSLKEFLSSKGSKKLEWVEVVASFTVIKF